MVDVVEPDPPYQRVARYYDAIYTATGRDPTAEIASLCPHLNGDGLDAGRRLILDAGCGTGVHLGPLGRYGRVEGVDRSEDMLQAAKDRAPGTRLHRADFLELDLGRRYHVICSLFGSLGYLEGRAGLVAGLQRLGAHLEAGGRLIVEPPLVLEGLQPPRAQRTETLLDGRPLVREGTAAVEEEALLITFDWHHHGAAGHPAVRVTERHRMLLLPIGVWLEALETALPAETDVVFDPEGPRGRGLFVATLSSDDSPGSG